MPSEIIIKTPVSKKEIREFVHFAWEIYKDDPLWVPPLIDDTVKMLTPGGHPFYEHGKVKLFTAWRDGKMAGRIAGITNTRHNEYWDDKVGFFGFFECIDDQEVANVLLKQAEEFVRSEGMDTLRGPESFSQNEECGLLIEGWDRPPIVMCTWNPPYYQTLIENAGFVKAQDLVCFMSDIRHVKPDGTGMNPKILRVAERIRERMNLEIRTIDMHNIDRDAAIFKEIYNQAWSKNWGFVPLTEAELDHEIEALKPIIDPGTVTFAFIDGKPVGAGLPLPDVNQALIRAKQKPGVPDWWALAKLMFHYKLFNKVTTLRAFAGGVIEEYRGNGIHFVLAVETMKIAAGKYDEIEYSWVLESNIPMRETAANMDAHLYRTYRLYDRGIA